MQHLEMLRIFLRLGPTGFGGPIAHIGYFRDEFVTSRHDCATLSSCPAGQ